MLIRSSFAGQILIQFSNELILFPLGFHILVFFFLKLFLGF